MHFSFNLLSFSHKVMSDSLLTSWTVIHQAPLSMEFSRREYWNGLPFPSSEALPDPGIEPHLLHWQADSYILHDFSTLFQSFYSR